MTYTTKIVAAAATALLLGTASPAMAQDPAPAPAPEQAHEMEEVTSDELERFARSYLEISQVGQQMEQRLASVQDPNEAQEIQAEAQEQIVVALGENDLTPERYQEVGAMINADPELQEELVEILEELQEEDPQGGGL